MKLHDDELHDSYVVIYYTQSSMIQEVLIGWIHKMAEETFYSR